MPNGETIAVLMSTSIRAGVAGTERFLNAAMIGSKSVRIGLHA